MYPRPRADDQGPDQRRPEVLSVCPRRIGGTFVVPRRRNFECHRRNFGQSCDQRRSRPNGLANRGQQCAAPGRAAQTTFGRPSEAEIGAARLSASDRASDRSIRRVRAIIGFVPGSPIDGVRRDLSRPRIKTWTAARYARPCPWSRCAEVTSSGDYILAIKGRRIRRLVSSVRMRLGRISDPIQEIRHLD